MICYIFISHLLFFSSEWPTHILCPIKKNYYLFACLLYLWLCWAFPVVRGPSLVRGAALVAEHRLTVVAALVVEHGPQGRQTSAAGAQTRLPLSMWTLPGPGIKLLPFELQRGFLTAGQTAREALFPIFQP